MDKRQKREEKTNEREISDTNIGGRFEKQNKKRMREIRQKKTRTRRCLKQPIDSRIRQNRTFHFPEPDDVDVVD